MKIATTTGDFSFYCKHDEDKILELHRAGFRCIDLSMYSFSRDCAYMRDDWREAAQKIKTLADELGMTFVQAHSQGGNPLSDDRDAADFIVAATLRSIEICAFLGIPNTVVHAGIGNGLSKEAWFEKNRAFYQKLLPTAERFGVNVLCENSTKVNIGDRYYANSGKDMRAFVDYVGHPRLHVCWDTGHANCEGPQYDEITALGEHLFAVHYNDNRGRQDEHLAPYLGTMNHDEVMHALIDVGFRGPFTLECDASLRSYHYWLGDRRPYEADKRLSEPPLCIKRKMEEALYESAKYILSAYGLYEA